MKALVDLVGRAVALEILLEGRVFGAEEAKDKGLVNRVVPDDKAEEESLAAARRPSPPPPFFPLFSPRRNYTPRLVSLHSTTQPRSRPHITPPALFRSYYRV